MKRITLIIILVLLPIFGFSQRSTNYGSIPHIKKSKLNSNGLFKINEQITDLDYGKINSLLISINGELVFENFYNGFQRDSLNRINSINKTITGILFGILCDQHPEISLKEPIYKYFPEYKSIFEEEPLKKKITIHHLLEMSAGFKWNEWSPHYIYNDNSFNKYKNSDSTWVYNTLKLPLENKPGEVFTYNSGISQLVASIIEKVSKQTLLSFAQKNLFDPLDIRNFDWILDYKNGYPAWGGLKLTSGDMLKIGDLIYNDGMYKEKQIVSTDWMDHFTKKHKQTESEYYGYHIWIKEEPHHIIFAAGYGDNFIFIIPKYEMVIVVTAANYVNYKFQKSILELVNEILRNHE